MHNLLKNRRYLGEYRHGDPIVPDGMPAIVSQGIFDKVQARMAKNKHAPASTKAPDEFILTTKLFCGHDGVFMVGTSGTSKTGKVHRYYKCGNTIYKKSCNKKAVRKDYIEWYVVGKTKELMLNDAKTS